MTSNIVNSKHTEPPPSIHSPSIMPLSLLNPPLRIFVSIGALFEQGLLESHISSSSCSLTPCSREYVYGCDDCGCEIHTPAITTTTIPVHEPNESAIVSVDVCTLVQVYAGGISIHQLHPRRPATQIRKICTGSNPQGRGPGLRHSPRTIQDPTS